MCSFVYIIVGRRAKRKMPRYYCDYCDTYLTHDSAAVRKQHNSGYKHKANVRNYYMQFDDLHPSLATPPPAQQIPGGLPPHLLAAHMAVAQAHGQLPMSFALPGAQPGQQLPMNLPRPPFPFPPGMIQPGQMPPGYMMPPANPAGAQPTGMPQASVPFGSAE